jgi:hypothetical protein
MRCRFLRGGTVAWVEQAHNVAMNLVFQDAVRWFKTATRTRLKAMFLLTGSLLTSMVMLVVVPPPAQAAPGSKTFTVPPAQMQQAVGKRFPIKKRLADVIDITALAPRLALLPEANRLGTEIDLDLLDRLSGRTYQGTLMLDYGLRFERADNSIRMTGVRVKGVRLVNIPEPYNNLITQTMPQLAEQLLADYAVHTLSEQDMMLVSGLGFEPGEIKVTSQGLRVTLDPMTPK